MMKKVFLFLTMLLFAFTGTMKAQSETAIDGSAMDIVEAQLAQNTRDMWDLLGSFEAAEEAQYGVATDGTNLYTSNWGYSSATHNFYKYDMQGNVIEGFEIDGCGTLRGMTYDGQYFYGVANSSTVYCVDLANHTLVSQFNSAYGAMRCITYDPVRDGFWVVGNWQGDLTLIDRTGAIVQVGPTPQSASDVAYYMDADNVEHVLVYCQPSGSGSALVFDYDIATNTLDAAPIFDVYNNLPGVESGSSGGAFVGEYNGKTAFFANIQQSPNLIGIYGLDGNNSFTEGFEGGLNGWNVLTVNTDGGEWLHSADNLGGYDYTEYAHGGTGFAMCYSFVDNVGAYDTDSYLYTPKKYVIENGSTLTFWADNANDGYPEDFSVVIATADNPSTAADFTQIWNGGAKGTGSDGAIVRHNDTRSGNWRQHTIDLSAYAGQSVYIGFHDVNYDMYEIWIDDVALTKNDIINMVNIEGFEAPQWQNNPYFEITIPAAANYQIEEVNWYCNNSLMSAEDMFDDETADYYMEVVLSPLNEMSFGDNVSVTYNGSTTPYDPSSSVVLENGNFRALTINYNVVNPSNQLIFDFEDGTTQGWTTIDADGDGFDWMLHAPDPNYINDLGHEGSDYYVHSQSYDNNAGVALTPDNYLVSPSKAEYTAISFWACAQDASYAAEHFGVAVSTAGNTDAADFTTVQEWTMTAKQGDWYEYLVDLNAYAGQEIWVAIRHFNCTDMFILNVDDITLAEVSGVEEDMSNTVSVYPNPAKDKVMVTSDVTVNEYRIYDVTGTEIMNNKVNSNTFEVNVDNMAAGVYFIRIYSDSTIASRKFIKE